MSEMRESSLDLRFAVRVLLKALGLFAFLNLIFAAADPLPLFGRASVYNALVPGRPRLPFGERPDVAYNFSLFQLDAMFASHEAAAPKPSDEYRVILIGDSSIWGFLLTPEQSLSGNLNALNLTAPDSRPMRFYNFGYPTITLTKDLLILSHALDYQPDMVVWSVTLEAFPIDKQLESPIVQSNPEPVRDLIAAYDLPLDPADWRFEDPTLWDRTIVGRRRALADVFRLNLYGPLWAATGIDQFYPETYDPRAEDLAPDETFYGLEPPHLPEQELAFEVLAAGDAMLADIPLLIVNEPMFVSSGENSDIRYNFFYPIWAYDDYRAMMAEQAERNGWRYLDLWDAVPDTEYTNSAIHLTPEGTALLAKQIASELGALD